MSDGNESAASSASPSNASSGRLLILLGLLGLMVVALGYDWYVARPACDAAAVEVEELVNQNNQMPGAPSLSSENVHEKIKRKPSKTVDHENLVVETFTWQGGLPFRSYHVHVLYEKNADGKLIVKGQFKNQDVPDYAMRRPQTTDRSISETGDTTAADLAPGLPPGEPALNSSPPSATDGKPSDPADDDAGPSSPDDTANPEG